MRLALGAMMAVLLLVGCAGGAPPSQSAGTPLDKPAVHSGTGAPTRSNGSSATPAPSSAPAASHTPSPPAALPPIAVGDWVTTVVDQLTVRSAPGVGSEAKAVLPKGSTATVVAGPELADGYPWYAVMQPGIECLNDQGVPIGCSPHGWVASAARDASAWLVPAEPTCPDGPPTTVAAMSAMERSLSLACYGDQELSLRGYLPGAAETPGWDCTVPFTYDPDWLGYCPTVMLFDDPELASAIGANIHPDLGRCDFGGHSPQSCPLVPFLGTSVDVIGHLDDPAAASCVIDPIDGTLPDDAVLAQYYCRQSFVITAITASP